MNASPPMQIQLVVPIHDEGERFARFVTELAETSAGAPPTLITVVDDGSGLAARAVHEAAIRDAARVLEANSRPHRIEIVPSSANQGKGASIRLGWGAGSAASWLGFVDGDGAVSPREVWRLGAMLDAAAPFDALLAVRLPARGRTVRRTPYRSLQGRVFAALVERFLRLGVVDPQCGLKFFRASRLAPVLPALREQRWLLDAEILLALALGAACFEQVPIDWKEHGGSRVVPGIDPLKMLVGLARLRAASARAVPPAPAATPGTEAGGRRQSAR